MSHHCCYIIQSKDTTASNQAKSEKSDAHSKLSQVGGKSLDKTTVPVSHDYPTILETSESQGSTRLEMSVLNGGADSDNEYWDSVDHAAAGNASPKPESFHSITSPDAIEIIIEPPPPKDADTEVTYI